MATWIKATERLPDEKWYGYLRANKITGTDNSWDHRDYGNNLAAKSMFEDFVDTEWLDESESPSTPVSVEEAAEVLTIDKLLSDYSFSELGEYTFTKAEVSALMQIWATAVNKREEFDGYPSKGGILSKKLGIESHKIFDEEKRQSIFSAMDEYAFYYHNEKIKKLTPIPSDIVQALEDLCARVQLYFDVRKSNPKNKNRGLSKALNHLSFSLDRANKLRELLSSQPSQEQKQNAADIWQLIPENIKQSYSGPEEFLADMQAMHHFKSIKDEVYEKLTGQGSVLGLIEALNAIKIAIDCFDRFMPKIVATDDYKQMSMYEAFHRIKAAQQALQIVNAKNQTEKEEGKK